MEDNNVVWVRVSDSKLASLRARFDDDDDERVVDRVLEDCVESGDPLMDMIGIIRGEGRRRVPGEEEDTYLGMDHNDAACWGLLAQLVGMGESHDGASADDHDQYALEMQ
jgi:hypothetical protein